MCTAVQQIDLIITKRIGALKKHPPRTCIPTLYLIMPIIRDMLVRGGYGLDLKRIILTGKIISVGCVRFLLNVPFSLSKIFYVSILFYEICKHN